MNIVFRQPRGYYGDPLCPLCRKVIERWHRTAWTKMGWYQQAAMAHETCAKPSQ